MKTLTHALVACLLAVALAGCADDSPPSSDNPDEPGVGATKTTGGIRGVVVDQGVVPLAGATVKVFDTTLSTKTDENGLFVFSGMQPGTYTIEASHPLYDTRQTTAVVEAGVEEPKSVRMQLVRVIFDEPRMVPFTFQGYIFCSANIVGAYSEECGEGVGYPCELPRTLYGCGDRMGKNPQNKAGQEWFVDSPGMKTFIVEQSWTPSFQVSASGGGQFRTFVSENWVCDPWCGDDYRFNGNGGTVAASPLYVRINMDDHKGFEYNATTRFTTFTYAADNPGLLLEQSYELFVHTFHLLPAPEGWSIVNGDENPF